MSAQDCHVVRGALLAHRAGELSPVLAAAVDDHLASCDACARTALRLGDMLGAARELDGAALIGDADALFERVVTAVPSQPTLALGDVREAVTPRIADPDALFSRIVAEATAPARESFEPARESGVEPARESFEVAEDIDAAEVIALPVRRWWPAAVALAAVALAAFALVSRRAPAPSDAPGLATLDAPAIEAREPAAVAPTLLAALDDAALAGDDALRVFAEPDARWSLSGESERVLRLDEGTVLVEFVPLDGATLRVEAPGYDVRVVGTVFYASTELQAPVGVLTGAVEVSAGDDTTRVAGGEAWTGDRVAALSAADDAAMGAHVDVDAHGARLDAASAASEAAEAPARESGEPAREYVAAAEAEPAREYGETAREYVAAAEAEHAREYDAAAEAEPAREIGEPAREYGEPAREFGDEPAREYGETAREYGEEPAREFGEEPAREFGEADATALLDEGRRAAREGRDADAVDALEAALAALPGGDARGATLRLDLARIYAHQLDRPEPAARHLRAFLADWPDDVAAGVALDELCRITTALGAPDARCDGGVR